jgi:hypothetical protein
VCPVDPQHGQDLHCGGRRCCTHRTIAPQKSRGTPPLAGVLVDEWGAWEPMRLAHKRAALSPSRSADSAGWVKVVCAQLEPVVCRVGVTYGTCVPLCPPSLSDLQRCKPHRALNGGVLRRAVVGQPPHPLAHEKSAAVCIVKPRGEHSWCGRCGSCPTSTRWAAFECRSGLLARALLPPYAVDTR